MMEYRPRQKAKFGSIEAGKAIENTRERLRALVSTALEGKTGDKANQFLWRIRIKRDLPVCGKASSGNCKQYRGCRSRDAVGDSGGRTGAV